MTFALAKFFAGDPLRSKHSIFGSGADEVAVFSILLSIIVSFSGRENSGLKTKNDATIKTSAAIKRNCFIFKKRSSRFGPSFSLFAAGHFFEKPRRYTPCARS